MKRREFKVLIEAVKQFGQNRISVVFDIDKDYTLLTIKTHLFVTRWRDLEIDSAKNSLERESRKALVMVEEKLKDNVQLAMDEDMTQISILESFTTMEKTYYVLFLEN